MPLRGESEVRMKRIAVILAVFVFGAMAIWYAYDDHKSLRYVLWKQGLHRYPSTIMTKAVGLDLKRDDLVRGLTKEQLLVRFPDAHEGAAVPSQEWYERQLNDRQVDHLWIGASHLAIVLRDGRGDSIAFMKG